MQLVTTVVKTVGPLSFGCLMGVMISVAVFPRGGPNLSPETPPCADGDTLGQNLDYERFEAVVHPPLPIPVNHQAPSRPRFYATELGAF